MKENLTEIIFILDRSGSMGHLTQDTIGGFNSFIEDQRKAEGEALLTTVLFDDKYEILHNGVNLKDVKPMTTNEYYARGMTALSDAVGKTINEVGERLSKTEEDDKPSKVIFVITTDGDENSSKEFTQSQIKSMIQHQTDKYNWQFLFLGANIDAASTAQNYGIALGFASNYTANPVGTQSLYKSVSKSISNYRCSTDGVIDDDWSKDIK